MFFSGWGASGVQVMVSIFFPGTHKIVSRGMEGSGQPSSDLGVEGFFPQMSDQIFEDTDAKKMVFLPHSYCLCE